MRDFRKVSTKEDEYKNLKSIYNSLYQEFQTFLKIDSNSKTLDNSSQVSKGKVSEYPRFLIFSIILHNEIFSDSINTDDVSIISNKLNRLKDLPDFKEFNQDRSNFYGSTISAFEKFVTYKSKQLIDLKSNEVLETKEQYILKNNKPDSVPTLKKRPEKIAAKYELTYVRSSAEVLLAKQQSNWKCTIDPSHLTFINQTDNQPYIEAHHLIPMAAQDYFDYTIDFADNIVTLCPNCHRQIHYAVPDEKAELVEMLFKERRENYKKYGIEIDLTRLKNFYGLL